MSVAIDSSQELNRMTKPALTALALLAAYVEEVRIGFERWGDTVAASVEEDGFYKVSDGFVVENTGTTDHSPSS